MLRLNYLVSFVALGLVCASAARAGASVIDESHALAAAPTALHPIGPQRLAPSDPVVYDAFTGGTPTYTSSTPHTYMGGVANVAADGVAVDVTAATLYMVSTTAVAYTDLVGRIQFWDAYDGNVSPVYSTSLGEFDFDLGPLTTTANAFYPIDVNFTTPVPLSSLTNKGFVVNWQGDTGAGLADTTNLTSLIAYGAAMTVGSSSINGYYRNVLGETNFNFASTDLRSLGQANQRVAIILYGKTRYSIGGTINGASGAVSLKLDGSNPTTTQTQSFPAGAFTFTTPLLAGSDWTLSVDTPPAGQSCTVTNGSGSGLAANVSNISVDCVNLHTVTAAAADTHGAITPPSQNVADGSTATFTVTPNAGFEVASVTGDTCTVTQQGVSTTWTSSVITQDCAVTATFADFPSQCTGAANFNPWFFDDFPGSSLDPSRWSANANFGSITVANNSVALDSIFGQFPFVTSAGSPIPPIGPFSVRWVATYTGQAGAGDGTLVISQGLPPNSASDDYNLRRADAWQDTSNGFQVRMRATDAGAFNPVLTDLPPTVGATHDIEYCYLPGSVEIWVDGVMKTQVSSVGLSRPDALWFGNPVNTGGGPTSWNPFTLYYVEVRALNDEIFKDGFGN